MAKKTLFDETDKRPHVVLSSNFSIYPLFSRGCLLPPEAELGADYLFPKPHNTQFIQFQGGIPKELVFEFEKVGRNLVPVAIALSKKPRTDHFTDLPPTALEAILLSNVEMLAFRNEKELTQFAMMQFADVDIDALGLKMEVNPAIFEAASGRLLDHLDTTPTTPDVEAVRTNLRRADAFGGLCCGLMTTLPGRSDWFQAFSGLLAARVDRIADQDFDAFAELAAVCLNGEEDATRSWEAIVLAEAAHRLLELKPSEGWPAKALLSDIAGASERSMKRSSMADETGRVLAWAESTRRILDDEAPLPSLGDNGSMVLRALLLLLVRRTSESLRSLRKRHLEERVGQKVWRLAYVLATMHEGLRALPKELKYGLTPENSRKRLEALGAAVNSCNAKLAGMSAIPNQSVAGIEEFDEDGTAMLAISLDGRRIVSQPVEQNPALEKAASDCRYFGFEVGKVGEEHFDVFGGLEQNLKCTVQVSVWNDPVTGFEVLRFKSIVKILAGKSKTSATNPEAFLEKSRQLSKSDLISMLLSNADVSQNCRVALQKKPLAIVVLVDQMLDTMDRDECVAHLRNVSNKAVELSARL